MITSNQIQKTAHYKTMENVNQLLIVKKTALISISLGVTMSGLKGFDFWVKTTSPRYDVKCIVSELIK